MSIREPGKVLQIPWNFCRWVVDNKGRVQMYLDPTKQLHSCFELVEELLESKDLAKPQKS